MQKYNELIINSRGFTLAELLTTLAMVAILAALAVPSFSSLIRTNALTQSTNSFLTAVNLAKSEAVTRGGRVVMCKRSGTGCDNDANWEDGWVIFVDEDEDNIVDAGEEIRYFDALKGNQTLRTSAPLNWIMFQSRGQIRAGSGGFPVGGVTFSLCASTADAANLTTHSRALSLNGIGRVTATQGAASCP